MTWASVVWTQSQHRNDGAQLIERELSRLYGVAPEAVCLNRICPMCGSSGHGRLVVVPWDGEPAPPAVSLSRSSGLTAVAVTPGTATGIDVEDVKSFDDHRLAGVLLHPQERADVPGELATTWVRKESLLKAAGCGLSMDPRRVRLSGPRESPVVLEWPDGVWAQPTWILDLDLAAHVRAAVAGSGRTPADVSVRQVVLEAPGG